MILTMPEETFMNYSCTDFNDFQLAVYLYRPVHVEGEHVFLNEILTNHVVEERCNVFQGRFFLVRQTDDTVGFVLHERVQRHVRRLHERLVQHLHVL